MTEEDSEVFEITDFTTASEWERFIARLEEVIHEWKLTNQPPAAPLARGQLTCGTWEEKTEVIQFADFKFNITRHWIKQAQSSNGRLDGSANEDQEGATPVVWQDMMSVENDFPSRAHCLCRWYGLRDFVVIAPTVGNESVTTESRANILLSSVSIALNNTGSPVPIFIQVQQKWRRLYYGQCEAPGFRTSFEMVHLKKIPHQYSHLAGLLDVFKAKLNTPVSPLPAVSVSVRFTYVLQDWPHYTWPQVPPDMDSMMRGEVGCTEFDKLPFGACEDPVSELHLSTTWPSLSEQMIVDNDVYSDLDPLQAPHWSVRVRMLENPQCLLGDYLQEFIKLCRRKESTDQLLGKHYFEDTDKDTDISQALQRLTEPAMPYALPSLGTVVTRATTRLNIKPEEAPIPGDLLNEILLFLFPDAKSSDRETSTTDGGDQTDSQAETEGNQTERPSQSAPQSEPVGQQQFTEMFRQFKSAPPGSLTDRLAVCMCIVNHSYGGLRAVAHLWQEFVLEMRYRWENNFSVPGLDGGTPNMGCSILHQKLQMLNCCIERKKAREAQVMEMGNQDIVDASIEDTDADGDDTYEKKDDTTEKGRSKMRAESSDVSDEDEFYECTESSSQISLLPRKSSAVKRTEENENKSESDMKVKKVTDTEEAENAAQKTLPAEVKFSVKIDDDSEQEKDKPDGDKEDSDQAVDSETHSRKQESDKAGDMEEDQGEDMETESKQLEGDSGVGVLDEADSVRSGSDPEVSFKDSRTHQPEGRLTPCAELKLLHTDEKLYIPVTQEPAPMTEDMLEEHAEVLARLGTSAEGAHLRARMQSACLLSDMESFKAANPGCILGDFVRWYSPRDWLEQEEVDEHGRVTQRGQLSARMQIPGNMWVEVWQSAKAVPARRQRRLFDDTKEAEKVLHYLAAMKPAEVAIRLMPMLIHAAIRCILQQKDSELTVVKTLINQISSKAAKVMRQSVTDLRRVEDIVHQLTMAEVVVTRAESLKTKFSQEDLDSREEVVQEFVTNLLEQPEVTIVGASRGPVGTIIHNLFSTAQKSSYLLPDEEEEQAGQKNSASGFPQPVGKEYILRTTVPRPTPWSRPSPQRMFCVLINEDFRLGGAFTTDTTFQ